MMVVYKTYKYRVYPTREQVKQIELTFKMCAFVWNKFLERLTKAYRRRGESLTIFDCDHILTQMKDYYPWLAQVDNKAMRCTIRNLFDAKKAFYRRLHAGEKPGYPRYKSEHNPVSSYTTNAVIHVTDDYIQLPKVKRLKYKRSRPIEGSIVEATVTRDVKGRYYVSICCAVEAEPLPTLDTSVTIRRDDVDFAVDSNGTCYAQPENLDQQYRRLRREVRRLHRMVPSSQNYQKQRQKVEGIYQHINNIQSDHRNKLVREIIRKNQVITVEAVDDARMRRDREYAEAVKKTAWREFIRALDYQARCTGRELVVAPTATLNVS